MKATLAAWFICVLAMALYSPAGFAGEQSARFHFLLRCSGCHGVDGNGAQAGGIPDFRDFVGAFASDDAGRTYVLHVPGVSSASLNDADIASVMNYVMLTWGGASLRGGYVPFTPDEVTQRRARVVPDVVVMRRDIVQRLSASGIITAAYPWP